ncbi:ATP-binding protein, partial [Salmonella enterica]|uniref:ATP-binding protein n=1 Tax=Salmonella enterica TaxID=28901 RepID=UPI003CEB960A
TSDLVEGDELLVRQAVANLVRNSVVHNVPGGWVRVDVRGTATAVVVEVENSGPLLTRELVATLPEPFVRGAGRARGSRDGAGLGLAIV